MKKNFMYTDEFGKGNENVTSRIIKSDAGTAVGSTVWNYAYWNYLFINGIVDL